MLITLAFPNTRAKQHFPILPLFATTCNFTITPFLQSLFLAFRNLFAMLATILQFYLQLQRSMEYVTIKDLSAKFAIPERTVYYQINHTPGIRTKKQGRSKVVNLADFAKACGKDLQ
ncbi:MAG: hypothetical protein ACRBG0_28305 [Lewinella sp.]|uniref:hypothetical protein n=1 Tax=Lewinella sp. TaxID=2004506 RepID=UPI003D6AADA1